MCFKIPHVARMMYTRYLFKKSEGYPHDRFGCVCKTITSHKHYSDVFIEIVCDVMYVYNGHCAILMYTCVCDICCVFLFSFGVR